MNITTLISSIFACLVLASCGGHNDAGAVTIADSVVVADTIAADSVVVAKEKKKNTDSIKVSNISTSQQAIDYMRNSADADKYEAGILIKMAEQSLDYTKRLLQSKYDYFIVVDKPSMHVVLFDKYGREKAAYKMACARNYGTKHKRSDCRTPEGFFSAEGIYNSTDWLYTNDAGYTSPTRGVYGPRFIRLQTPVTRSVGIHGTGSPGSLGRRVSHGCIRLHNNSILDLVKYAKKGMPIIVNPSDRDQEVNRREGHKVVQINIGKPTAAQPTETAPAAKGKKRGEEEAVQTEKMASDATKEAASEEETKTTAPSETPTETPAAPAPAPAAPETPAPAPATAPAVEV